MTKKARTYKVISLRPATWALLNELKQLTRDETGEVVSTLLVVHRAVVVALEIERAKKEQAGGG